MLTYDRIMQAVVRTALRNDLDETVMRTNRMIRNIQDYELRDQLYLDCRIVFDQRREMERKFERDRAMMRCAEIRAELKSVA